MSGGQDPAQCDWQIFAYCDCEEQEGGEELRSEPTRYIQTHTNASSNRRVESSANIFAGTRLRKGVVLEFLIHGGQAMFDSLIKSRRFWVAASAIAVVLLKDKLPLDEQQIQDLVLAIGAWIVGESLRSSKVSPPA